MVSDSARYLRPAKETGLALDSLWKMESNWEKLEAETKEGSIPLGSECDKDWI